jgi:hypothetical protein
LGHAAVEPPAFDVAFPEPDEIEVPNDVLESNVGETLFGAPSQFLYYEDPVTSVGANPIDEGDLALDFGAPVFEDPCCSTLDIDSGCMPTDEPCPVFPLSISDSLRVSA